MKSSASVIRFSVFALSIDLPRFPARTGRRHMIRTHDRHATSNSLFSNTLSRLATPSGQACAIKLRLSPTYRNTAKTLHGQVDLKRRIILHVRNKNAANTSMLAAAHHIAVQQVNDLPFHGVSIVSYLSPSRTVQPALFSEHANKTQASAYKADPGWRTAEALLWIVLVLTAGIVTLLFSSVAVGVL